MSNTVRSVSSAQVMTSSPSSSGARISKTSITRQVQLKRPGSAAKISSLGKQHVVLSKSMESSFLRLKSKKVRSAYVESELVNGISHQIRILRQQRGWTQSQLARKLKTTQAVVSRLEDASYGRYSLKTLLQVGAAFDVGMFLRYMPFSQFMAATWNTRPEKFEADSYDDEVSRVHFASTTIDTSFEKIASEYSTSGGGSVLFSGYVTVYGGGGGALSPQVNSPELKSVPYAWHKFTPGQLPNTALLECSEE